MSDKHITDKFVSVDRYYISGLRPHIWKHPEGEMVYFDDYVNLWVEKERLKAEVERLRKFNDEALAHIAKEERKSRERLDIVQADVERLIKAGDAVCESPYLLETDPAVIAWRAAKEDFYR